MTFKMNVEAAYASGRVRFMGLDLLVVPGALVPREETELLGRTAVDLLRQWCAGGAPYDGKRARVIDMCCGAGNLACAIAHHVPQARIWASDLTDACVDLTRRNVDGLRLTDRVSVHQGDLFEPLRPLGLDGSVDMIVCNPPYISDKRLEGDRTKLLVREPREAFAAGPYGLSIYVPVVRDALAFLRPEGMLLFEVGLGQDRQVKLLFDRAKAYGDVRIVTNEAGEGRVVLGRKT